MKKNLLGNSDLELSEIGFGTWAIGGGDWGMGWGDQHEPDSVACILEGLESGINWIDTAHAYGFGVAEIAVGKALKEFMVHLRSLSPPSAEFFLKMIINRQAFYLEKDYISRKWMVP